MTTLVGDDALAKSRQAFDARRKLLRAAARRERVERAKSLMREWVRNADTIGEERFTIEQREARE